MQLLIGMLPSNGNEQLNAVCYIHLYVLLSIIYLFSSAHSQTFSRDWRRARYHDKIILAFYAGGIRATPIYNNLHIPSN